MSEPERSSGESHAMTRLPSAEEREAVVKALTAAFAEDAIAVGEFERRVAEVYAVRSAGALAEIIRDLPVGSAPEGTGSPASPDSGAVTSVSRDSRSRAVARRPSQRVVSVFSSIERKVDGVMPEILDVRAVMGSVELDLRRADFPPGVTEIRVRAVMGNIELELPEHVKVEDEGHAVLGTFSVRGRFGGRHGNAESVVRVTGRSILGNVEIELDD